VQGSEQATELYFLAPDSRVMPVKESPRRDRRVICSLGRGMHSQLMAVSSPTLASYARRWKWDLFLSSENLAPERPIPWSKVRLMQELLDRYDTIWWIDADALIVDTTRHILDELPATRDLYLVEHPQASEGAPVVPNFGVVLLRSTEYTRDFLQRLWDMEEFIDHNWWENAAVVTMLGHSIEPPYELVEKTPDREHVGFLDVAWNSVPDQAESPAPVIRHHARGADVPFDTRLAGMVADLSASRLRDPRWS